MKRCIRIVFGSLLCPIPMLLATYVWMWDETHDSWMDGVGLFAWYFASGQWEKLPD